MFLGGPCSSGNTKNLEKNITALICLHVWAYWAKLWKICGAEKSQPKSLTERKGDEHLPIPLETELLIRDIPAEVK